MRKFNLRDYEINEARIDDNLLVESAQYVLENMNFGDGLELANRSEWRMLEWLTSGEKVAQTIATLKVRVGSPKMLQVLKKARQHHIDNGDALGIREIEQYPVSVNIPFNDLGHINTEKVKATVRYDESGVKYSINIGSVSDDDIEAAQSIVHSIVFSEVASILNKSMRK